MHVNNLSLIAYASGVAAGDMGCEDGPLHLKQANLTEKLQLARVAATWKVILQPLLLSSKLAIVSEICHRLAVQTQILTMQQKKIAVLAGDHSCAMGTWSGVLAGLRLQQPESALGLVWIDAHMDSHTFETTPSGNIHGMPLAALLGQGAAELTQILISQPKLQPAHVSLIGIRSYETAEAVLLARLGVRIYKMAEVQQRGIVTVLKEAIVRAKQGTQGYGVSLDLDAIDPKDAPGVGSPAAEGLQTQSLLVALKQLRQDPALIGVELAEFNPHRDVDYKTEKLVADLLVSIFGCDKN